MALGMTTDALLPMLLPIAVYWVASGLYHIVMSKGWTRKHRLFTDDEADANNLASRRQVVVGVLVNQSMQMFLAAPLFLITGGKGAPGATESTSLLQALRQLFVATMFVEPWGYFWHGLTHESKFLYKHLHSLHHRMIVPYAYGGQYIHPLDALFGDIVGSFLATLVAGMSPRMSTLFFTMLTLKVVNDHCGLLLPKHPVHRFMSNNAAFHAIHHQHFGIKHNYSVHFFSIWDRIMGTYMPYAVEERKGGRYKLLAAPKDQ